MAEKRIKLVKPVEVKAANGTVVETVTEVVIPDPADAGIGKIRGLMVTRVVRAADGTSATEVDVVGQVLKFLVDVCGWSEPAAERLSVEDLSTLIEEVANFLPK